MLHRLWLEYASSRCELSDDTLLLSRRLAMKVTRVDLASLNHAGFLDIVASKTLAEGYHDASARAHDVEVETEEEKELTSAVDVAAPTSSNGAAQHNDHEEDEERPPLPDFEHVLNVIDWS